MASVLFRVSVCKGVDCRSRGSDAVWAVARQAAARLGLPPERCWLYRGGCYGLCQLGPNVVIRPARPEDDTMRQNNRATGFTHVRGERPRLPGRPK